MNEFSKKSCKILFVVDHKHRDLGGVALIGYYLRFLGYDVRYVALWEEDGIISQFDPGTVVLPKPISHINKAIGWKKNGRSIIVVDTEGSAQDLDMRILVSPDVYFFWNPGTFKQYMPRFNEKATKMIVVGSPRLDFFHKRFRNIFGSRKNILRKIGLPDRKTITIATSSCYDLFSEEEMARLEKSVKTLLNSEVDYVKLARNHKEIRNMIQDLISESLAKFSDINVILKPHPNEDVRAWIDFLKKGEFDNVRMMVGEPINTLLAVSDLFIAHNWCTTIFEASLMDIPTIEIFPYGAEGLYPEDSLGLGKYLVRELEELKKVVLGELYGEDTRIVPDDKKDINNYVENVFCKADGFRCLEYALQIDKFMKSATFKKHNTINFFAKHPNYILPYFPVLYHRYRPKVRGFIKKAIFYDKWKVKKQDTDLLDGRGRYDNRMKPGDENVWFKRFEEMGLDAGALIEEYRQTVTADEIKQK
jgi:surface carbohydrate biosynthesis protein